MSGTQAAEGVCWLPSLVHVYASLLEFFKRGARQAQCHHHTAARIPQILYAVGSSPSVRAKRRLSACILYFHLALRLALCCALRDCATEPARLESKEQMKRGSAVVGSAFQRLRKRSRRRLRHDACCR